VETTDDTTSLTPANNAPPAGSAAHRLQREVLLELLTASAGESSIGELASRLDAEITTVRSAATALGDAGLAEVRGEAVSAAPAAIYFDALWPIVI
jgi:DNA-binding transcriptional ArsR family regulator